MRSDSLPWFYTLKDSWYVWRNGKRQSLGVKGRENQKAAYLAYAQLTASPALPKSAITVREVIEAYLAEKQATLKPSTYRLHRYFLKPFGDQKSGNEPAESLKHVKVYEWANRPSWGQSSRYGFLRSMSACFHWAEEKVGCNPLKGIQKPPIVSRGVKAVLSAESYAKLFDAVQGHFRPVLTLLKETGARPSEVFGLTAGQVDFKNSVAILTEHKTDGTGIPRFIYLSEVAVKVLKELASIYPTGPLLRNRLGEPWNKDSAGNAMRKASAKAGVKGILYGLRHTFATDMLASGVSDSITASLLGHSSTTMLHKHYSHLTSQSHVLREALRKRGS